MIYDSHIVSVLTQFYLDKDNIDVYHGRWDTYLASKNLWDEYFYLMYKTDEQVNSLLTQACENAKDIANSPLAKAMREN